MCVCELFSNTINVIVKKLIDIRIKNILGYLDL